MRASLARGFLLLAGVSVSPVSFADPLGSGWSMGVSCPPKGRNGNGTFTLSSSGGFAGNGDCRRVAGRFTRLDFTGSSGGTLRSSTQYALQTPSVLVTPPLLTTDFQPIFSVASACPVAPSLSLNWLFVQWTESERRALANTYLFGTATYSGAVGTTITGQYDVDGSPYFVGRQPMPGSCTNGIYNVNGSIYDDINGTIYYNAAGMGTFKTSAGRATFFFPRVTLAVATDFGSKSFQGLAFDSDSANGVGDVRQVKATADGAGTTFTIEALADPESSVVDGGVSGYTDTLVFSPGDINNPAPGMLFGTVTRTGAGAGSGRVACIANNTDSDVMLMCSGESPSNNTLPFHFSLYSENQYNRSRGPGNTVRALARDPVTGKIYIGGDFTTVDSIDRSHIARLNTDGSIDTTFDPGSGFNNAVYTLALDGAGKLYVGGNFTTFRGAPSYYFTRLNGDGSLDTGFNPGFGFNGAVYAVALEAGGKPVVAGNFSSFNGTTRVDVARINTDGSVDTGFDPLGGTDGMIYSVAISPTSGMVYVGGPFTTVNGVGRSRIARLLTSGALDTGWNPGTGINGWVNTLAVDASDRLVAGGPFLFYDGNPTPRIARIDGTTAALDTTFDPGTGFALDPQALAIDATTGAILVGGTFTDFDGAPARGLVRLTASGSRDTSFDPGTAAGGWGYVHALALDPVAGTAVVGGLFSSFDGMGHASIVRVLGDGSVDGTFGEEGGAPDGAVSAIVVDASSGKRFVGGAFNTFGSFATRSVARVNSDGTVDTSFDGGTGVNGSVMTMAAAPAGGKVYIGGYFTSYDGSSAGNFARLNGDGSFDTTFASGAGCGDFVFALAVDAATGKVYVGGNFLSYDGSPVGRLVRLNSNGTLDTTFATGGGFNAGVKALVLDATNGKLYVGGGFATYDGVARDGVARLNLDGSLDTSYAPAGYPSSQVNAMALDAAGRLVVGGNFSGALDRLAADGSDDATFDPGAGPSSTVLTLLLEPTTQKLYVGGIFGSYDGFYVGGLARANPDGSRDTTFSTGTGFDTMVEALSFDGLTGKLTVGGAFARYGNATALNIARLTYSGALD